MIRVANIIEDGRLGGPHMRISEVAKRLYENSVHTIVVLPHRESGDFQNKLKEDKVSFRTLPLHHLTREKGHLIKYLLFFFFELWNLYRIIKKENIDIVHISSGSLQYKGLIAAKLAKVKVLMHLNDTNMPGYVRRFFRPIAKYLCDGFIVAGNLVKQYYLNLVKINNKPIFEIQAPVDCQKYNPSIVKEDSHISNHKGIKIITVANINFVKGLEFFIEMASLLNQEFDNLSFWIVGQQLSSQKKYYNSLINLIEKLNINNLFFYGLSNDVRRVLKSGDLYVCSSTSEASPMSVWEAMAMAKPVVSTDVGDVSRFIKDDENGFVVPVGSSKLIAEKCALLLNDKEKAKKFGIKSREIALKNLEISICVKKHYDSYMEILNKTSHL